MIETAQFQNGTHVSAIASTGAATDLFNSHLWGPDFKTLQHLWRKEQITDSEIVSIQLMHERVRYCRYEVNRRVIIDFFPSKIDPLEKGFYTAQISMNGGAVATHNAHYANGFWPIVHIYC